MTLDETINSLADTAAGKFDWTAAGPPGVQLASVVAATIPTGDALQALLADVLQSDKDAVVAVLGAYLSRQTTNRARTTILANAQKALGQ
jgi:hypothetical protein